MNLATAPDPVLSPASAAGDQVERSGYRIRIEAARDPDAPPCAHLPSWDAASAATPSRHGPVPATALHSGSTDARARWRSLVEVKAVHRPAFTADTDRLVPFERRGADARRAGPSAGLSVDMYVYVNIARVKRTTIYLDPELEVLLKLEMLRQKRPMAELVREAVQAYVTREPRQAPPGAGAFASGRSDTADRVDDVLAQTGFGERRATARGSQKKR